MNTSFKKIRRITAGAALVVASALFAGVTRQSEVGVAPDTAQSPPCRTGTTWRTGNKKMFLLNSGPCAHMPGMRRDALIAIPEGTPWK